MTNDDARLWEITENLHRADLSRQERADQTAEWVEIVSRKLRDTKREGRPGAQAAAAREMGVSEDDVNRSIKIAGITEEAKEAAREVGLDNNQAALLKIASTPADQQTAKVYELKNLPRGGDGEWRVAFERLWNKASPDDRAWAREFIDTPVMSESAFG
jgi:hypothetical protein